MTKAEERRHGLAAISKEASGDLSVLRDYLIEIENRIAELEEFASTAIDYAIEQEELVASLAAYATEVERKQ